MERLYRSDRQNTALDVVQTSDNGYLILSAGREPDSTDFDFYTITKLSDKGDFGWSKDYQFEEKVDTSGTIHLLEEDSFLIYGSLQNMPKHRFLMKGDPSGNVAWTKGYENDSVTANVFTFKTPMDTSYQSGYIIGGVEVDPLNQTSDSWVAELDGDGEFLWAKYYSNPDYANMNIVNAQSTRDSGLIVCGSIADNPLLADICLIKTDSLGDILWSRKYGDTLVFETATAVIQTPDDGYLMGGTVNNDLGILIKTDTLGLELWSRNVDFEIPGALTIIHQIIMASDGNAIVAGTLFGANDNFAFMVKVDMIGNVVWKRKYKASTDDFQPNGLTESTAEGYVFVTTSEENGEQVGPHLIKTNNAGETMMCDTAIMEDLLTPIIVMVDTLLNVATADTFNTLDITVLDTLNYNGFNPPLISLEQFGPYCPDEIFSDTLDATVPGAIGYEWESGETTPTLVVTEFDTYAVTVTMGEDYCYILCASTAIQEKPLPVVSISVDEDPYCTLGFVNLTANANNAISLEWSTTETSPTIQVTSNGNYSVTATNECDIDVADLDLMIDMTPPAVEISAQGDYCTEGVVILYADISDDYNSFLWSTGESVNDSIIVTQSGIYDITVTTANCGESIGSYEVLNIAPTVSISTQGDICEDDDEQILQANATGPVDGYIWSTEATTDTISVVEQGTYSVTVTTPFCGESAASIDVVCDLEVSMPNVFTPDGDDENDTFQPFFNVPSSDFVEYRFCVYSRWGEKVFETTNPDEAWDGKYENELAVGDVYIWTLEGRTALGQVIDKDPRGKNINAGDVTLLR